MEPESPPEYPYFSLKPQNRVLSPALLRKPIWSETFNLFRYINNTTRSIIPSTVVKNSGRLNSIFNCVVSICPPGCGWKVILQQIFKRNNTATRGDPCPGQRHGSQPPCASKEMINFFVFWLKGASFGDEMPKYLPILPTTMIIASVEANQNSHGTQCIATSKIGPVVPFSRQYICSLYFYPRFFFSPQQNLCPRQLIHSIHAFRGTN